MIVRLAARIRDSVYCVIGKFLGIGLLIWIIAITSGLHKPESCFGVAGARPMQGRQTRREAKEKEQMRIVQKIVALVLAGAAMPAAAQDVANGAELYRVHCATCHGIDAGGQGPMAGVLLVKPADLTGLEAGNGGVFPTERIVRRIDGRDPLVSHGSPMPVYGFFFEGDDTAIKAPSGQPILTSKPIVDLLAYLQSLQSS